MVLKDGQAIDYGFCVWSTGNAPRPLVQSIVDQIPDQQALNAGGPAKLAVDPYLRVVGAEGLVAMNV